MNNFNFLTTHVGSVPHKDPADLTHRLASSLDIPAWLQLPRRNYLENIYTQYAATLPGAVVDAEKEKAVMRTDGDFEAQLEVFYQSVIDDRLEDFALTPIARWDSSPFWMNSSQNPPPGSRDRSWVPSVSA